MNERSKIDVAPPTSCHPTDEDGQTEIDLLGETFFSAQESGHPELAARVLERLADLTASRDH